MNFSIPFFLFLENIINSEYCPRKKQKAFLGLTKLDIRQGERPEK
jgi:hypothetical protein